MITQTNGLDNLFDYDNLPDREVEQTLREVELLINTHEVFLYDSMGIIGRALLKAKQIGGQYYQSWLKSSFPKWGDDVVKRYTLSSLAYVSDGKRISEVILENAMFSLARRAESVSIKSDAMTLFLDGVDVNPKLVYVLNQAPQYLRTLYLSSSLSLNRVYAVSKHINALSLSPEELQLLDQKRATSELYVDYLLTIHNLNTTPAISSDKPAQKVQVVKPYQLSSAQQNIKIEGLLIVPEDGPAYIVLDSVASDLSQYANRQIKARMMVQ